MQHECKQGRGKGQCSGVRRKRRRIGSVSECICYNCGTMIPHRRGVPCFEERCPKCGVSMERKKTSRSKRYTGIWYAYL
uniref:Ferredoxin n=1 Tax=Thermodesulfovibrio aggregans TaxID=86166 RepID=A0A7C4EQC5_9BACT